MLNDLPRTAPGCQRRFWKLPLIVAAAGMSFWLTGCRDEGPQVVPVSGTVTFEGQPLAEAGITFAPANGRAAFGMVKDGRIESVTTFQPDDGVIVGTVQVGIQSTTNLGKMTGPHRPLIPERYFDPATSGIEVAVTAEGPNEFLFELTE